MLEIILEFEPTEKNISDFLLDTAASFKEVIF